jgi:hypothetical protein
MLIPVPRPQIDPLIEDSMDRISLRVLVWLFMMVVSCLDVEVI